MRDVSMRFLGGRKFSSEHNAVPNVWYCAWQS
jgi:hypothetical protein